MDEVEVEEVVDSEEAEVVVEDEGSRAETVKLCKWRSVYVYKRKWPSIMSSIRLGLRGDVCAVLQNHKGKAMLLQGCYHNAQGVSWRSKSSYRTVAKAGEIHKVRSA